MLHGIAGGAAPTIDGLLNLRRVTGASISPDGRYVAYGITETDWDQDASVRHLWIAEAGTGRTWQLTRGKKGVSAMAWSPDGQWLGFVSDREGGKAQIFAIRVDGGEALQLTKSETAVNDFDWSRDGQSIAFTAPDKRSEDRKNYFGDFEVVRRDYAHAHLWTLNVAEALKAPVAGKQLTKGKDFSIGSFDWSPDGTQIAFSATVNPDLVQGGSSDIYVMGAADGALKKIVDQPGPDSGPKWSPDGKSIVFRSAMAQKLFFHSNARLAIVAAGGGKPRSITDSFDEQPSLVEWTRDGIYFGGARKTEAHLFRVDPTTAAVTRVSETPSGSGVSLSREGRHAALVLENGRQLPEVYVTSLPGWSPRKLTDMTAQVRDWTLPASEVISWKSTDGTVIEGVLSKPAGFDPGVKYPLLCVIHGGPTGIDTPQMAHTGPYPIDLWVARGALVLRVNYRG
ncbi:MAG: S9 family peptidase, partial [Bryobacteraceae bacterium]|nr:S9 family peptidase [Bryobacteraceae bacterium]